MYIQNDTSDIFLICFELKRNSLMTLMLTEYDNINDNVTLKYSLIILHTNAKINIVSAVAEHVYYIPRYLAIIAGIPTCSLPDVELHALGHTH